MRIHIDFETRSVVDLNKAGVHVYVESPTTDVWCAAFSIGDGPIELWFPGQSYPESLRDAVEQGAPLIAWNAAFDRVIWRDIMTRRYDWPETTIEHWRCSMTMALAMGFPGKLANAAPAIGLDITKDAAGARLMKQMMRPRKTNEDGSLAWWSEPAKIDGLAAYCRQDVEVERAIYARLCPLPPSEQELYFLDQRVNDRGAYIDLAFCEAVNKIVGVAAARIRGRMAAATGGRVGAPSQLRQLSEFCAENGVETASLNKDSVTGLLDSELPDAVREALELRQVGGKTSFAKVDAAMTGRSADGRARGLFFFDGATTGRWAGRRVQLQNMQRPDEDVDVELIIGDVLSGDLDLVEMLHGPPLVAIGNAIRGMITAAPGNRLIAADFSNIEGRVLAYLAGEQWKLDAFAAYDVGTGPDLYKVAYGRAFGVPPEKVSSGQRQIGKVMELALGFQGGVKALLRSAQPRRLDLGQSYGLLCETAPESAQRATEAYAQRGEDSGIVRETWIAAEIIKLVWRDSNPNIVKMWADLEKAAIEALSKPGEKVSCNKVCFLKRGSFLWLQLPSGRPLCYPYPRLSDKEMPWLDRSGKPAVKQTFTFKSQHKQQFVDSYAYGGLWAENVTQATARDLLAEAMKRLDAEGYPVVSHAHDEAVAEVPQGAGSVESFCRVMSEVPAWATGCPIAAAGWAGTRYRKA